jgi:DNA anti-recombination protein RmuC
MSEETNTGPKGPPDPMRIWMEMASCATEAMQAWTGAATPEAIRQNRASLYKVWGDYWEQFLRSAPFLEGQRRAMDGSLQCRNQLREQLERWNHQLQLASSSDIDRLMTSLRRLVDDVSEQGERLEQRLDDLSARLDALAAQLATRSNNSRGESGSVVSVASARKPNRRRKSHRSER